MIFVQLSVGPVSAHLNAGIDALVEFHPLHYVVEFWVDVGVRFAEHFQRLKDWGFLEADGDSVTLNRDALLQVDRLLHEFFLPEHRNARYA